jgi:Protein of unknown function (DUF2778)
MAVGTGSRSRIATYDHPELAPSARPQRLLASAALICIAFACSWTLLSNLASTPADHADVSGTADVSASRGDRMMADVTGTRGDRLSASALSTAAAPAVAPITTAQASAQPTTTSARLAKAKAALTNFALMFDPRFNGTSAGTFTGTAPAQPPGFKVSSAPAQTPPQPNQQKVASLAPAVDRGAIAPQTAPAQTRTAAARDTAHHLVAKAAADTRTIFEKLFGKPTASPVLAYADADGATTPVDGVYDHTTAVYDISAHKVYLPDGTTLEAHSGLGAMLDDPDHADVRDRGVTPPTLYDLKLRESLFHGVQALRLIPVDGETATFGRSGLLAHTYMLGPNGDSNGCVSFKDYSAFLEAYESHKIDRLAVVTHLD